MCGVDDACSRISLVSVSTRVEIVYAGSVPLRIRLQLLIRRAAADHVSGVNRLIMHRRSRPRRFRVNGRLPPRGRGVMITFVRCYLLFIGCGFARVRRRPRYRTNYSAHYTRRRPSPFRFPFAPAQLPPPLPHVKKPHVNATCRFSECFFVPTPAKTVQVPAVRRNRAQFSIDSKKKKNYIYYKC